MPLKHNLNNSVFAAKMLPGGQFEIVFSNSIFQQYFNLPDIRDAKRIYLNSLPAVFNTPAATCMETNQPVIFRHISLVGSEKKFWLTQILPMYHTNAFTGEILCISNDITNLETYEDDFVKSKILLDRLYEIFPAAIFITDEEGFIIECNRAAEKIFGYTRDEYLKMNILNMPRDIIFFRPDYTELPANENPLAKALLNKTVAENEVCGLKKSDREVVWVSVSSAFLNMRGYGVVCTCRDITKQQNQAQKILQSKEILQAVINSSFDAIIFLDKDLRIAWYNIQAEKKVLLFSENSIRIGNEAQHILSDESDKELANCIKEAQKNKIYAYERSLTNHEGETLWFYRRFHPAYNEQGEYIGCVVISTNITDRKKKELDIKSRNDKLREIARVQSHELRRPLANIMGLISLLQEEAKKATDIDLLTQLEYNAKELDKVILKITRRTEPG